MSQRAPDYEAYRADQARRHEADRADNGAQLARIIHERRRRKCVAAGEHTDGDCQRCGL